LLARQTSIHSFEILKKHGETVTIEEAKLILEFLRNLAKLALEQYFGR